MILGKFLGINGISLSVVIAMMCQITFLGIAHLHLNKSSKQNNPTTT